MTAIVVDKELREKLNGLDHEVIICDDTGQTVGRYLPEAEYMEMLYRLAHKMFDEKELDEASRQAGGYTTAQVLEYLSKL